MFQVAKNISLQEHHSLASNATAQYFAELNDPDDIQPILQYAKAHALTIRVLGGGSNLILSDVIDGLVIQNHLKGIDLVEKDSSSATINVKAGENWHHFVKWCVEQGYFGLENLALIPGSVGAAPVQNIGAYGVEVGDWIQSVSAIDLESGRRLKFSPLECQFGYRNSVFKSLENRYLITDITFRLDRVFNPNLTYGPLAKLQEKQDLTASDVFNEVVTMRQSKLPDPTEIPNAGSFFKNPIVDAKTLESITKSFPDVVHFPFEDQHKLAAGWLIDKAGLKGLSNESGVGCYEKQALVLVNPDRANSTEILKWADHVSAVVKQRFDVELEIEPRLWI